MISELLVYCIALFVATLLGGAIMLARKWSEDWLHLFLSLGAGIFLGAVFRHLLPEAMGHGAGTGAGLYILAGYLLIFLIERFLAQRKSSGDIHGHMVASVTAFIGLSVHSVMEGFGLALTMEDPELARVLLVSILAHKVPAAFSLVSLMVLAKLSRTRIVINLLLFAAAAPAGALVLGPILEFGEVSGLQGFTGLVTGSFLYVATADLLPEVFHSRRLRWVSLGLMLIGILLMCLVSVGHEH
jgi:zinc transporter ZupT